MYLFAATFAYQQPCDHFTLDEIKEKLEVTRYAVFKKDNKLNELYGTITQTEIDFVQKNSFTKPGTSILKII